MDITSTKNDRVKLVRALQTQSKARHDEGLLVLEGGRLIQDALDCALVPDFVFYIGMQETLSRSSYRIFRRLLELNVLCLGVTEEVMQYSTDLETHQGLLAVFPVPDLPIPASPTLARPKIPAPIRATSPALVSVSFQISQVSSSVTRAVLPGSR